VSLQGLTRSSEFRLLAQGLWEGVQQAHCSGARQLRRGLRQKNMPVTSLRHQGAKSFLRGAQFF